MSDISPVLSYVKRVHTAWVELKTGQINSPTKPHWSSQAADMGQAKIRKEGKNEDFAVCCPMYYKWDEFSYKHINK